MHLVFSGGDCSRSSCQFMLRLGGQGHPWFILVFQWFSGFLVFWLVFLVFRLVFLSGKTKKTRKPNLENQIWFSVGFFWFSAFVLGFLRGFLVFYVVFWFSGRYFWFSDKFSDGSRRSFPQRALPSRRSFPQKAPPSRRAFPSRANGGGNCLWQKGAVEKKEIGF